jgi:hypothetical protein
MEPDGRPTLPSSQQFANGPYPEPNKPDRYPHAHFIKVFTITIPIYALIFSLQTYWPK